LKSGEAGGRCGTRFVDFFWIRACFVISEGAYLLGEACEVFRFVLYHTFADPGNAVRIGDSRAKVTGYEPDSGAGRF